MTKPVIALRLTIEDPVPGVSYSLQDGKSTPVGPVVAGEGPLSFEVPVRVRPGLKLTGGFVRREGAERRFVYIAVGTQAGDRSSHWSRRAKIDIHDIPAGLLDDALAGIVLECRLPGRAKDKGPSCGTIMPLDGWRAVR
ncbi:DUF5990 family protein [Sphingosinicella terrae]|uniref:DUF5990 family protein n=1 Tax=Sphingosinicella terrae TaxID=2172047 RepID=UPI000E0DAB39|nr:DUF5990 family protein [Sphingosinicella terrae]